MMNCIAIDDEPLALDLLEDNVRRIPFLKLVGKYQEALEAMDVLKKGSVDLIFIDIEMPELNGIEFVKNIVSRPMVIFTTAYDRYAMESYNLDVVDYLLKPLSFDRFFRAANKAHEWHNLKQDSGRANTDFIFVKADYHLLKVMINEIVFIEGLKDYVKIHLANQTRAIIARINLKSIEERLPHHSFCRVHKSFIVSIDKIVSIRKDRINLPNNAVVPISENYKSNLYKLIDPKTFEQ